MMNTINVVIMVSRRVGHVTFSVSERTSWRNLNGLTFAMLTLLGHMLHGPPARQAGPAISPYIDARIPEKPLAGPEGELKPGRSGGTRTPNPRFWRPVL